MKVFPRGVRSQARRAGRCACGAIYRGCGATVRKQTATFGVGLRASLRGVFESVGREWVRLCVRREGCSTALGGQGSFVNCACCACVRAVRTCAGAGKGALLIVRVVRACVRFDRVRGDREEANSHVVLAWFVSRVVCVSDFQSRALYYRRLFRYCCCLPSLSASHPAALARHI
jgi:hypothetical protein